MTFPAKALDYTKIWAEAFSWMADRLNITAQASAADKRSPWEQYHGKVATLPLFPFLLPGRRHRQRQHKEQSKGEFLFYLNSGRDHSYSTHKVLSASGSIVYTSTPRSGTVDGQG